MPKPFRQRSDGRETTDERRGVGRPSSFIPRLCLLACLAAELAAPGTAFAAPGDLVPAFGAGGVATSNPSGGSDQPYDIAVDATGVYIVGHDRIPGNDQWRLEKRRLDNGALCTAANCGTEFGTAGVVTSNPSTDADVAYGVAINATGIYVAGGDFTAGNLQWRIEKRDLITGALIPAFGPGGTDGDGVVTSNPSGNNDGPYDIAVDATGVYIVGYDYDIISGNDEWRIEKRDLTNGNLLWWQASDPGTLDDTARGVAVDSSGIYVVGVREGFVWNNDWYMEKRALADGALLWTQISNPSGDNIDEANGVAVDSSGIYVVGFGASGPISMPSNPRWRIEKRDLTDGNLLWARQDVGGFAGQGARGVAVDSSGIYTVGYVFSIGEGNIGWRIEKRDLTGTVLWEIFSSPSPGADSASGVAVGSSEIYVTGYDNAPGNAQWRIEKRKSGGGGGGPGGGVDCGLRAFDGTSTVTIDCEDPPVSPLRIQKGGTTYGISVVNPATPDASKLRIQTPSGVKALRRQ